MHHHGFCDLCGAQGPLANVHFRQNTGMLIMRQSREVQGASCRSCGTRTFLRMTLHNLVFGWWGMISFFVTPVFILLNFVSLVPVLGLPKREVFLRGRLDEHRDYAVNLLASKDESTVIEVLERQTGVAHDEVANFVRHLPR